ncbi:MAG: UDP-3-O-(3-hydroxymyristoyl)glucosamine N-acyltransferase [Rhizomicrobium sp.]
MADPRFYENKGPFALSALCQAIGVALPPGAPGDAVVADLAALNGAGPGQLAFFVGGKRTASDFSQTNAGFCLVPETLGRVTPPAATVLIPCASVQHAFAQAALLFYPDVEKAFAPSLAIDPTAVIGADVVFGAGVVIGPGVEIGAGSQIGANTVIGRGVSIGRHCAIGANVTISHSYIGDHVTILSGAVIGEKGFGFASSGDGHAMIAQLGRVILQDKVEVGANTTIDRGALSDTVIGEGTKIDNLVQIGHNVHVGRHCIIVSQCGISGSSELGDFVVFGGQVGIADHCRIGTGAQLAGRTALTTGQVLEAGHNYAGVPAKPLMDWIRELYAVAALIKKPKRDQHD